MKTHCESITLRFYIEIPDDQLPSDEEARYAKNDELIEEAMDKGLDEGLADILSKVKKTAETQLLGHLYCGYKVEVFAHRGD